MRQAHTVRDCRPKACDLWGWLFQCSDYHCREGMLLTIVAKYHSNDSQISVNVVQDFGEGEGSWPNEAHLQTK